MKRKGQSKSFVALLSVAMAITLLPTSASAEDSTNPCTITKNCLLESGHDGDCITESPEEKEPTADKSNIATESNRSDDITSIESGSVSVLSDDSNTPVNTAQGNCGAKGAEEQVTWSLTENSTQAGTYTLTLSGNGDMADYTSAATTPWNQYLGALSDGAGTTTSTERGNGSQTFYKITAVEFAAGSNITHIGDYAFAYTMIENISFPEGVTSIGKNVFLWSNWLKSVDIPSTVTNLNYDGSTDKPYYNTFDGAFYLEKINVVSGNANYKSDNGILLGKLQDGSGWMIINCPDNLSATTISKNNFTGTDIVAVGPTAFSACRNLTQIDLPDSITSINAGAFNKCYSLTSFTMPASVTSFHGEFKACRNLTSIDFKNVVEITGAQLLTSMTPAEIGETDPVYCRVSSLDLSKVTDIGNGAFSNSKNLTSVTFNITAGTIVNIGATAFHNCGFPENTVFDFSALSDESNIANSAFDNTVTVKAPLIRVENAKAVVISSTGAETNCRTFEDALATASNQDTIKLLQDCQIASGYCTIDGGQDRTLDLNGHILRAASGNRLFIVSGSLTIIDSSPDAVHYYTVDDSQGGLFIVDDNNTENANTIKGGIITGGVCTNNGGAFVLVGGSLNIKAGNIVGNTTTSDGSGGINVNNGTFEMSGGSVMGNVRHHNGTYTLVDINGGKISGGTFTTELSGSWCTSGLYPYDNGDGTYTVSTTNQKAVAAVIINNQAYYYNTVKEAFDQATTGSIIQLIKDCQLLSDYIQIKADKNLTLDLNGHILRAAANNRLFTVNGTLNIIDSNPDAVHYYTVDDNRGGLFVVDDSHTENAKILKGGIITGGHHLSLSGGAFVLSKNNGNAATLNISGGNIVGNISDNTNGCGGINVNGETFTMSGGSVMGNVRNANGTYSPADINGGSISGGTFSTDVQSHVTNGSIQYVEDGIYHVISKDFVPSKTGCVFDGWLNDSNQKVSSDALTKDELYHPSWTTCSYAVNGDTISESYAGGSDSTATLSAPENLTYNGQAKEAVLSFNGTWHGNTVLVYKNAEGHILTDAPVNAGFYTATLTAIENGASITVNFTIQKSDQALTFDEVALTKHINTETVTNTLNHTTGDGEVSYTSDNLNVATVDDHGTVTIHGVGSAIITATVTETENYNSASATYVLTVEDHNWSKWTTVKAPNCTDHGSKQRTCSVCNAIEEKNVDPNGHDWEEDFTIDQEPTCTDKGSKSIHCKNCNVVKDTTEIPANGHTYDQTWKSDENGHWHECTVCHEKDQVSAHSFQWILDKEATEKDNGSKHEECSICHYKKDAVEIPAIGTKDNSKNNTKDSGTIKDSKVTKDSKAAKNSKDSATAGKTAVQTGDISNFWLYISLLLVSIMIGGVTLVISRKRH